MGLSLSLDRGGIFHVLGLDVTVIFVEHLLASARELKRSVGNRYVGTDKTLSEHACPTTHDLSFIVMFISRRVIDKE